MSWLFLNIPKELLGRKNSPGYDCPPLTLIVNQKAQPQLGLVDPINSGKVLVYKVSILDKHRENMEKSISPSSDNFQKQSGNRQHQTLFIWNITENKKNSTQTRVANSLKHHKHGCGTKVLKMRNHLWYFKRHWYRNVKTALLRLPQLPIRLKESGSWASPSCKQPH